MGFTLSNQQQLLSKIATGTGDSENTPYFDGWKAFDSDPYHPTTNPQGVIQMGLAENQVRNLKPETLYYKQHIISWLFTNWFLLYAAFF